MREVAEIESLRKKIDKVDYELVLLFAKRIALSKKIARLKKRHDLPLLDETREKAILNEVKEMAKMNAISSIVIEEIFNLFLEYSKLEMLRVSSESGYESYYAGS